MEIDEHLQQTLYMIILKTKLTVSLQFDPAPREGEPQVSRRTPGTTILDSCWFQTTSSKRIPLYCRRPHLLGECWKEENGNLLVLFTSFSQSICIPTFAFQFVLFPFAFVLGLLLDGGSGYNVIYCSTPQECQEYKLCNAYKNYYDTHITTSPLGTSLNRIFFAEQIRIPVSFTFFCLKNL